MTMKRNATPPQITTVEDLLAKMRAGTRQHHEIRIRDLVVPVRVLSIDEVNAIRREALKQSMGFDDVDKNVIVQKTTLRLASAMTGAMPALPDKLLDMMSVDELNYMYEEYVKVMDDVNPAVEQITNERVRELVEAVKKNLVSAKDLSIRELRTVFSLFQDLIQRMEAQPSRKDS